MSQNYFPFEQLSALVYTPRWEERRKGTIDQSAKKPKISKNKIRGGNYGVIPRPRNNKQNYPLLLSEDVIADMKKMRPQDLMNILIDDQEIADKFPEGTRESVQSCKCPRQYFGWGEMKK